jgi:nucleoside phosphorylase
LHLDYDQEKPKPGDVVPYQKMLSLVLDTIKPQIFITTGTGGGVGAQVALGDVVLASQTRFHCTSQFAGMSWRSASYATTPVTASALALITPALTKVNAARVAAATPIKGRATPTIWSGAKATIVTTDLFAFDTSDNKPFGLQGLGQVCDMGDAMAGQTLSNYKNIHWYAIRNASDPQIPDEGGITYEQADHEAGTIYRDYGPYTTAASVIASWAIIADAVG